MRDLTQNIKRGNFEEASLGSLPPVMLRLARWTGLSGSGSSSA